MLRSAKLFVLACCCLAASTAAAEDQPVDFAKDVLPILKGNCFKCHGPDEHEGELRLDAKAIVLAGGLSGPAVVPGKADESPLYLRVAGIGDDDQMPPEGDALPDEQVALIRRWIEQGAKWPDGVGASATTLKKHWAYVPPHRPELPDVKDKTWPRNAVDHFVLARLKKEGWQPSPQADRAKLLRRVYLDLIGLPPSVEEVDAFLADKSDDAYEKVVDRLLASEHYGERWARPWLDGARYADSNGFQADQYREVWPYRDWVVNAMNADMPFTQFTREQIAGDLIPDATIDQKIATGFHRQTTCNVEAGVDPEENRVNQIFDRVNTTGTVWLGTSLECAQCHNHKYDPFSQADYYGLFAYFNNTPLEVKHTTATTYDFFGPKMNVPLPDDATPQQKRLKAQLVAATTRLEKLKDDLVDKQPTWEKQQLEKLAAFHKTQGDAPESKWQVVDVVEFKSSGGASHKLLPDASVLVGGKKPNTDTYTLVATTPLSKITAIKLETLTHQSLPGMGPGRHHPERPNFVLQDFRVVAAAEGAQGKPTQQIKLHSPWADYEQPQYKVAGAIDDNAKSGWAIHQQFHKPHAATFRTTKPGGFDGGTRLTFTLVQNHGEGRTIGRLRLSVCEGEPPKNETAPQAPPVPDGIASILETTVSGRTDDQIGELMDYYRSQQPEWVKLSGEIEKVKTELGATNSATTLVMTEMKEGRKTTVFKRGDFQTPLSQVEAGTPVHLPNPFSDLAPNRLGLADWLTCNDNPLTARVQVNRWWAQMFGRGIVRTVEDFGTQGDPPTHPELLDWLAVEFMEGGWRMKRIHKLIVISATYQQSSKISKQALEADPRNTLLARGPRVRLSAEAIRDNALTISGLLSRKVGGPPVYPPQPSGIWRHVGRNAPKYNTDTGEDRYRRGLYVVWRRSAPYPSFVNFDAPDRAACVVARARTNTPLQALTLLNDEAYIEMSWAFADRIATANGQMAARDRLALAFRMAVARSATAAELDLLQKVYQEQLDLLKADPAKANKLIGKRQPPEGMKAADLGAWFYVANILLNLDETITKG